MYIFDKKHSYQTMMIEEKRKKAHDRDQTTKLSVPHIIAFNPPLHCVVCLSIYSLKREAHFTISEHLAKIETIFYFLP